MYNCRVHRCARGVCSVRIGSVELCSLVALHTDGGRDDDMDDVFTSLSHFVFTHPFHPRALSLSLELSLACSGSHFLEYALSINSLIWLYGIVCDYKCGFVTDANVELFVVPFDRRMAPRDAESRLTKGKHHDLPAMRMLLLFFSFNLAKFVPSGRVVWVCVWCAQRQRIGDCASSKRMQCWAYDGWPAAPPICNHSAEGNMKTNALTLSVSNLPTACHAAMH